MNPSAESSAPLCHADLARAAAYIVSTEDDIDTSIHVRPQDMIAMAAAFAHNDDLESAVTVANRFPGLFPSEE